ncbi:tetratricopeptide repeat protein [Anabaena azotica]|uniref:Tetratricopeptide repeat protein n=1 Tax=Anabaena azotica FACHB-119 TaxID=947527 RepID=A0ABR8CW55_9NOST|nr:tetratricopeptide repeat protein [Anabaena azotica]MBD2499155.1 tetratricopeptide repeat protein [Anabaena azotica FACHB-119]
MASSGEDYLVVRQRQIERKKRILTIVSVVSFFGSTVFGVVQLVQRSTHSPPPVTATKSPESLLQEQAKGYELVLQREPNNQVALEKLSLLRVQMQDFKGAAEILEKLVKQYPDKQEYKVVLEDMKKRQGKSDRSN